MRFRLVANRFWRHGTYEVLGLQTLVDHGCISTWLIKQDKREGDDVALEDVAFKPIPLYRKTDNARLLHGEENLFRTPRVMLYVLAEDCCWRHRGSYLEVCINTLVINACLRDGQI